jgi:hypothetical protein
MRVCCLCPVNQTGEAQVRMEKIRMERIEEL